MTDQMIETISDMLTALASIEEKEALVFIDNRPPTALSSYRGYYKDLAIERNIYGTATDNPGFDETYIPDRGKPFELNMAGYGTYAPGISEVRIKRDPTVLEFNKAFLLAVHEEFEGYKGGQFTMDMGTDLWVSENGRAEGLRIVGMEVLPGRVDFVTREMRGY